MRRPRTKLQVSTFPFLAVLLCAMGALLLLLFIMDRRAKIAAQYTVSAAVAERKKRTQAEEEARQAEWEKARDLLHQSLMQQQNQLLAESKGVQNDLEETNKKLALVQTKHVDLHGKVQGELSRIALVKTQIATHRAALKDADKNEGKSRAELIEAANELAELERAFQQLRALKEREKQVYSVVPYRGKHGDQRAPIYVECTRAGVVFHPEKKLLEGRDFTADSLRSEVERHTGKLAAERTVKEKSRTLAEERKGPYVLFLVRPDGIAAYYTAQSALKGYQLDFGYELVDEDWVLDFNGDPNAKPAPPITVAKTPRPNAPLSSIGGNGPEQRESAPISLPPPTNGGPGVDRDSAGSGKGPAFVPIGKVPSQVAIASSADFAKPFNGGSAPASSGVVPLTNAATQTAGGSGPGLAPITLPIPGNSVGAKATSGSPAPAQTPEGAPPEPGKKTLQSFGTDETQKPAPAPPLSRLLGNKDFIITVDCYADHATIFPSGLQYRWNASNASANDEALVQTVTNLIARRQASLRPGEPPYRPIIRFQVAADGLRTYLRVYPLLEHLRVTMTRENVEE